MLLDTRAAVWWLTDDPRLPAPVREAIEAAFPAVLVSVASIWELELKRAKAKFGGVALAEACPAAGLGVLDIRAEHAQQAAHLPPVHSDPFDRMIVAQAQVERRRLVTADAVLSRYDVQVLWSRAGPGEPQA